jgi:NTP pyrophosphatase (non-canonical NTP hydrolase)
MSDLAALARRLEQFADARDWAQFHNPKNLAMALAGEVGELVAEFQWLTPEQATTVMTDDAEAAAQIRAELGDVTNYLVRLADILGLDLVQAANAKIDANDKRYPADTVRASARKTPIDHWSPLQADSWLPPLPSRQMAMLAEPPGHLYRR